MDSSSKSPLIESAGAVFAFFFLVTALMAAVAGAWSLFQKQADAAIPTPAIIMGPPAPISTSVPDKSAEATESRDAESAHAMMGPERLSPSIDVAPPGLAHIIPASLPQAEQGGIASLSAPPKSRETPRIAIIIDDMGLARKNSHRVTEIKAPITLSYLPYADDIQAQVDQARARGHEIMLHLPMEPFDGAMYPGPGALRAGQSMEELKAKLIGNLRAFTGYVGVNNHMGSRLTSTSQAMQVVMNEIDRRDVYFVDSWTSPRSVAYQTAAVEGIPRARRDVFLDHDEGEAPVWAALRQAEHMARRSGSAVVIGHPRDATIDVLTAWLPGALARGVEIVPMSQLIYRGSMERDPVLLADAARRKKNIVASLGKIAPASGE